MTYDEIRGAFIAARRARGLSVHQLADELRVHAQSIYRFEAQLGGSDQLLIRLVDYFQIDGITIDRIVRARNDEKK